MLIIAAAGVVVINTTTGAITSNRPVPYVHTTWGTGRRSRVAATPGTRRPPQGAVRGKICSKQSVILSLSKDQFRFS